MGFLLDTNVLSELMRQFPNPLVTAWLDSQAIDQLQTSAVSQSEILAGIAVLPVAIVVRCLQKVQMNFFSKISAGVVWFLAVQLPSNLHWFVHSDSGRAGLSAPKTPK